MIGWRAWWAVFRGSLQILRRGTATQRRSVAGLLAVLLLVYPTWWLLCSVFMALDHLLVPGLRRVELRQPLFIVGNMRTGSTWIQRLLAADEGMTSMTLADILLPAVTQKRMVDALGWLDVRLGSPGRRLLVRIEQAMLADYSRIHPVSLFDPEEDEGGLVYGLGSALVGALMKDDPALQALVHFDTRLDAAAQSRVMRTYRALARRKLYHAGSDRLLISKNPWFSGKIAALHRTFPDGRFLYLARDPRQVVPSTARLLHHVWHRAGILDPAEQDMAYVLSVCEAFYGQTLDQLAALPPGQVVVVRYESLCADLAATLTEAWHALGWTVPPTLAARLAAEAPRPSRGSAYTLEEWGLSEEAVLARLGPVCAPLGYPSSGPDGSDGPTRTLGAGITVL